MPSRKTLLLRTLAPPLRIFVCAACLERKGKRVRPGGTLWRSERDGLLYHPEHLPERGD